MPLDGLQKAVLKTLFSRRSPDSVLAGGSVLHRHAFRLSDDHDIFHPDNSDVMAIAVGDMEALRAAGFSVEISKEHEGLIECVVGTEEQGFTKIQWVQAGSWSFFQPVPDPDCGWCLHLADLAINKVLAAGGRRQVRDYVDLFMVHKHIMPLWLAIWAAPGKDPSWSPSSLAEKVAKTNGFRQEVIDQEIVSTIPLSAVEIGSTIRLAIEEARDIFEKLPEAEAGKLFVDASGEPLADLNAIVRGDFSVLEAKRGGNWPSGPEIDSALIRRRVDAFGWEGEKALAGDGLDETSESRLKH